MLAICIDLHWAFTWWVQARTSGTAYIPSFWINACRCVGINAKSGIRKDTEQSVLSSAVVAFVAQG